jgi:RAB protein geranylgeranyltransferase component A
MTKKQLKKISDLPPYTSMKEVMDDPNISMEEKERVFIKWVLFNAQGQNVAVTSHYEGEDIEERAVPTNMFEFIEKDLLEVLELKPEENDHDHS